MAYVNHKCVSNDDAAATHKKARARAPVADAWIQHMYTITLNLAEVGDITPTYAAYI
jgi:hypothetical protein